MEGITLSKELVIEHPNLPEERHPWNDGTKKQFRFDQDDIERLETGGLLWRGDTCYSVEWPDEVSA
jgi:hypothetical protein